MTRNPLHWNAFLADLERRRKHLSPSLEVKSKVELGQFLTPVSVARFMAGMFRDQGEDISVLDAGAGIGSLTAAFVVEMASRSRRVKRIQATLYEVDTALADALETTMAACTVLSAASDITFEYEIIREDFIRTTTAGFDLSPAKPPKIDFHYAILNPPYRKLNRASDTRGVLSDAGIEVNNLYSAFLALVARLLRPNGELVAITPRSFCNGPYFKAFRQDFFSRMSLDRIHVYESRSEAFRDDEVLQENLIFHAVKSHSRPKEVLISSSLGPLDSNVRLNQLPPEDVIRPCDPEMVVHVIINEAGRRAAKLAERLCGDLCALGLSVSTGRVVDFRARPFLRSAPNEDTAPLIYPFNLEGGRVVWPKCHTRKPVAIANEPATADLLIPSEIYVLVKRFSAKEERRRIVAALYQPEGVMYPAVGFENHLNYFHMNGRGLPLPLARGLTAFLNSTLADTYLRNFSGHTQVNAQDLRRLKYPSQEQLLLIASNVGEDLADQVAVDHAVMKALDLAYSTQARSSIRLLRSS